MCGFREVKLSSGLHVYTVLEWKLRMFHLRLSSLDTHEHTLRDSQHTRTHVPAQAAREARGKSRDFRATLSASQVQIRSPQ